MRCSVSKILILPFQGQCGKSTANDDGVLTGTPLENSIEDLAGVFGFIKPGLFSPMAARQMSPYTAKKLIEPFILRRRKQDVLRDLPPIVVNTVSLALSESQRRSYDMAERYGVAELQGTSDVTIQHVLALITRLKKICNFDPSTGDSSKVEYILEEFLPEACIDDQKAIIVSQYVETLNKLEEVARDYQPLKFHGQLSGRQRDSVLRTFSENHINRVLLLSLKAGGVGLNLTRANYLLHFDRWWNPAVEEQANARLHRIGQTRSVFVSRLICEDTIEERIDSILERKRSQFSQVVDELADVELEKVLSEEELFGLFGLKPPSRRRSAPSLAISDNPPQTLVIDPATPFSNIRHMRDIIRQCDKYIDWVDPHFHARALEELVAAIKPGQVKRVRILSGFEHVNDKARRDFERFARELQNKGVQAEWRKLDDSTVLHDRFIVCASKCWNVPPVNTWLRGSYSQVVPTDVRPPFEEWWNQATGI